MWVQCRQDGPQDGKHSYPLNMNHIIYFQANLTEVVNTVDGKYHLIEAIDIRGVRHRVLIHHETKKPITTETPMMPR